MSGYVRSGARTSAPRSSRATCWPSSTPRTRPEHRGRTKRTRKGKGESGAGQGHGGAVELAARVGAVSNRPPTKRTPTPARGGRGRRRPVQRRSAKGGEGVRQYRRPVRRRGHRAQRRCRIAGQGGRNDAAALFTVADIHQMRIYVPRRNYAAEMKDGMKATLELPEYPDRKFDATIDTTSHAIDRNRARYWSSFSPTTRTDRSPRAPLLESIFRSRQIPTL